MNECRYAMLTDIGHEDDERWWGGWKKTGIKNNSNKCGI